jgi:hypothetical protein
MEKEGEVVRDHGKKLWGGRGPVEKRRESRMHNSSCPFVLK